jgi:hypothetical protein
MNKIVNRLAGATFVVAIATAALSTRAAAPPGHYTVTGSTVLDNKTTLTWQLATSALAFADAPGYCSGLTPQKTWRVPTLKELLTLVDFSVASPNPTVDKTFSASIPSDNPGFWSANEANPVSAWYVDFSSGSWTIDDPSYAYNVRCVK